MEEVDRQLTLTEAITVSEAFGVKRRHYLEADHLLTALMASRFCSEWEVRNHGRGVNAQHRSHAMIAVMSSVAFLESLVNEAYTDVVDNVPGIVDDLGPESRQLMTEFWRTHSRASLLSKAQTALESAGAAPIELEDGIGHEAALLVDWRNALIHYKPEWHGNHPSELERDLTGRFPRSRLIAGDGPDPWPSWALGAGGASWAIRVAREFADEWTTRMNLAPPYLAAITDAIARRTAMPPTEPR
jgi:hypothetical protein